MPEALAQDTFVRSYRDRGYRHVALVRHVGTLLAFALDDQRQVVYSALDPTRGERDAAGWADEPKPLRFPERDRDRQGSAPLSRPCCRRSARARAQRSRIGACCQTRTPISSCRRRHG